jgi:uncharacterized protein
MAQPAAEPPAEPPVRVLLVTGVDYAGHRWKETTPALRGVLEKDSRLTVRVIEDHEFLASDAIFDYDVILLHMKNYDPTQRAEPGVRQSDSVRSRRRRVGPVSFRARRF